MEVKQLFKPHQIKPESEKTAIKPASPKHMFTPTEVEQKITEALAKREKEKAKEELGQFIKIRDAALLAFSPSAIVHGIGFSPDKTLIARVMSYADAHRYCLGTN